MTLGEALARALGQNAGIRRYGHFLPRNGRRPGNPSALDLSGAALILVWNLTFPTEKI